MYSMYFSKTKTKTKKSKPTSPVLEIHRIQKLLMQPPTSKNRSKAVPYPATPFVRATPMTLSEMYIPTSIRCT